MTGKAFASMFRRPFYVRDILMQMDLIGVGSLTVVMLTGFFTGAVLTLANLERPFPVSEPSALPADWFPFRSFANLALCWRP